MKKNVGDTATKSLNLASSLIPTPSVPVPKTGDGVNHKKNKPLGKSDVLYPFVAKPKTKAAGKGFLTPS